MSNQKAVDEAMRAVKTMPPQLPETREPRCVCGSVTMVPRFVNADLPGAPEDCTW